MDKQEAKDLTALSVDVKWLKSEIPKSLNQILDELRSIDRRVDLHEKRITNAEQANIEQKLRLEQHLQESTKLMVDHYENTRFRHNTQALLSIGKWLIPPSVVANLITAISILVNIGK